MYRFFLFITLFLALSGSLQAQRYTFTHDDTLRGSITPERVWWDLAYYHLQVRIQPTDSTISGSNLIQYKVLKPSQTMQIDLQRPLQVTKIEQDGQELSFRRDGDAFFVTLKKPQQTGKTEQLTVFYQGSHG